MKKTNGEKAFGALNYLGMILITFLILYPFFNQLAMAFSSSSAILNGKVFILPVEFTLNTFSDIAKQSAFWSGYKNTVFYTVSGTLISLAMTTLCSYALSKHTLYGRIVITKLIVFTMYFSGGLVPFYLLVKSLGMVNTTWALILPGAIIPYHVLIMRTYFSQLPEALEEAASIDGMNQFGYFIRIALPLSKPILATMTLFCAVIYWNDWFQAVIFLLDNGKYPVTLYLRNIMMGASMAAQAGQAMDANARAVPQSLQAASMILVIVPVLSVYPFVQKHFVKGVMIGAVKG